jgi:hypothetical protein
MRWRNSDWATHEHQLLQRAAYDASDATAELTEQQLEQVVKLCGSDFATAWLYHKVHASPKHAEFIREVDAYWQAGCSQPPRTSIDPDVKVAIVPGGFYREYPRTGADGRLVQKGAGECGLQCELIETHSFGPVQDNAELICKWLKRQPSGPLVLVSLCKGSADLKLAMESSDAAEAFRDVRAWINLSGIVHGTPLVRWVLSSRLRRLWYCMLLKVQRHDFSVVQQLDHFPAALLASPLRLPAQILPVHVVGFPLAHHMTTRLAGRCYRRILHLGPNDGGGVLLSDILRLPGYIYPLWGADHYLRPPGRDMPMLVRALLHVLADLGATASQCPTTTHSPPPGRDVMGSMSPRARPAAEHPIAYPLVGERR